MKTFLSLAVFFILHSTFVTAQELDPSAKGTDVTDDKPDIEGDSQRNKIEEAKRLFQQGLDLMNMYRWSQAEEKFRISNALVSRNSSLYNLALCLTHLDRPRESLEVLSEIAEDQRSPDNAELFKYKQKLEERLLTMVGTLRLEVYPASARITIDDRPIEKTGKRRSTYLDPGDHIVVAVAEGFSNAHLTISIEAGRESQVDLSLSPERISEQNNTTQKERSLLSNLVKDRTVVTPTRTDSSDESGDDIGYWILGGVGCTFLLAAGITTLAALDDESAIDDICPERKNCRETDREELLSLENKKNALFLSSDLLLGSGLALLGTSIVWWLVQNNNGESTNVAPRVNIEKKELGVSLSGYL
jgi:hypothetical protein